jgi:hypothetical protein
VSRLTVRRQACADGHPAQAAEPSDRLAQAGARWAAWLDPLTVKAPALMSFVTFEPHTSCVSSGAADIFWRTSNWPQVGQWYS